MKLIAADGYPVTPKDFRALYLSGGMYRFVANRGVKRVTWIEKIALLSKLPFNLFLFFISGDMYDIIITTNQTPRPYWIRVQGVEGHCEVAFQQAILKYDGGNSADSPPTQNTNALFNSLSSLPVSD